MPAESKGDRHWITRSRISFRWAGIVSLLISTGCLSAQGTSVQKLADTSHSRFPMGVVSGSKSIFGSYLTARFAEKQQDLVTAANHIARVLEEDSENTLLMRRAFILFLGSGQVKKAVSLAHIMTSKNVGTPFTFLLLAANDVKEGRFVEAKTRIDGLSEKGLAKFIIPIANAWISAGLKNFADSIDSLKALSNKNGLASLTKLHQALIKEFEGEKEDAHLIYMSATKEVKSAPLRLVRAMGSFLERQGKKEKARRLYESYLRIHPASYVIISALERLDKGGIASPIVLNPASGLAEGLYNVAAALPQTRASMASLLYVRIATFLKPDFPVAQLLMAEIFDNAQMFDDSIAIYRGIAKDSLYSWFARLKLAENFNKTDDIEEAKKLLEAMAMERPMEMEPLIRLGSILRTREDFANAEIIYDRAFKRLQVVKPDNWSLYYYRGISRERLKKWKKAEEDFLEALKLNPNQPFVLNYLGYSWVDQGINLDRAREMIERAVEQRRDDGYIVDSMGWVLYRLGDYNEAVQHLERAVELRPLDPIISDHLGDAYWRVGRRHEARFQWRRALSLRPEREEISKIATKLDQGLGPPNYIDFAK